MYVYIYIYRCRYLFVHVCVYVYIYIGTHTHTLSLSLSKTLKTLQVPEEVESCHAIAFSNSLSQLLGFPENWGDRLGLKVGGLGARI